MFDIYQNALVSGATSGIGKAIVLALSGKGLTVYAMGRNRQKLQALTQECNAIPLEVDVRDTQHCYELTGELEIDLLINNAGILSSRSLFQDLERQDIDAMLDINLKAPLHLTRTVLPGMIKRQRGHLLYIGSVAGHKSHANLGVYGASKAGISLFCENLRCDLLGTGVRVTEIAPGRVQTALYDQAIPDGKADALLYDGYRVLQPKDIAQIVCDVIALPSYANAARVEILSTEQIYGGSKIVKFPSSNE